MSIASDIEKVKRQQLNHPQAKILTIDIENSPNLAWIWGLWDQNVPINMLEDVSSVMCFAAKWYGRNEVMFYSDHTDGHEDMITAAWDLYNEADVVITYNGMGHDNPHLNREFTTVELGPPSPYKNIDLLKVVKKQFKFPSNKLDYVVQALGIGAKVKHQGFELWRACMLGDSDAWAKMEEYNRGDVIITEKLHDRILPWIPNYPVVWPILDPEELCCPRDGANVSKSGTVQVGLFQYDRYFCGDCGSWYRSSTSIRVSNVRGV